MGHDEAAGQSELPDGDAPAVLILGGTGEARSLAATLVRAGRWRVISSLAGRVSNPRLPVGEVRVGGFGGPDGLASWLRRHRIDAVVDATHPFAARISGNAAAAAAAAAVPLLRLCRPGWTPGPQQRWTRVPTIEAAATALHNLTGPVLLTTGRGGLGAFAGLDHRFVIRTVDPPEPPLPADHRVILDRGPFTVEGERHLMQAEGIQVLVTKDSGGAMTTAKLVAAADLEVPVVMVDRPASEPGVPNVAEVSAVLRWLAGLPAGDKRRD